MTISLKQVDIILGQHIWMNPMVTTPKPTTDAQKLERNTSMPLKKNQQRILIMAQQKEPD